MSSNNFSIHEDESYLVPELVEPKKAHQVDLEEKIFLETVKTSDTPNREKLPLKVRIKQISKDCFEFLKDAQWMSLLVDFFAIGARTCALAGSSGAEFVPYLSIASSPFYLYHAIKSAKERFKLMVCAYKTSRVADAIFWGGRGIGSVGTALSGCIKPLAGGVALFGLSHIPAIGVTFSMVLPIILIVLSVIGGTSEGWAMIRAIKVLQEFKKKKHQLDGSLESMESLLHFLQGPTVLKIPAEHLPLEDKHFKENHFTHDRRRKAVQTRIEALLEHHDLHKIRSFQERLTSSEVQQAIEPLILRLKNHKKKITSSELQTGIRLVKDIQSIYQTLLDPSKSDFQRIDRTLSLYDQVITLFEERTYAPAWKGSETFIKTYTQELKESRETLLSVKQTLYKEGLDCIETTQSEMHRVILKHIACLLSAILTLVAAILFLLPSAYHTAASGISIASSGLSILDVLFDKAVSQKSFVQLERFLKVLAKRKELEIRS